jgi:hypothetical protein
MVTYAEISAAISKARPLQRERVTNVYTGIVVQTKLLTFQGNRRPLCRSDIVVPLRLHHFHREAGGEALDFLRNLLMTSLPDDRNEIGGSPISSESPPKRDAPSSRIGRGADLGARDVLRQAAPRRSRPRPVVNGHNIARISA